MRAAPEPGSRPSTLTRVAVVAALAFAATTIYFALEARAARRRAASAAGQANDPGTGAGSAAAENRPAAADGSAAELRRLRLENQALRLRLWEQTVARPTPEAARPAPDRGGPRGWRDQLEELRKSDPERYQRIRERMERRRAERESAFRDELARIQQRLEENRSAGDSPAARKEGELLEKIEGVVNELSQLGNKWAELTQLSDEERPAQGEALAQRGRELYGQLATLQAEDRRTQIDRLGGQLGLNADQRQQLVSGVDQIVTTTDPRTLRPRGRGPGGGGRHGP